jgi:hypothetical protein
MKQPPYTIYIILIIIKICATYFNYFKSQQVALYIKYVQ